MATHLFLFLSTLPLCLPSLSLSLPLCLPQDEGQAPAWPDASTRATACLRSCARINVRGEMSRRVWTTRAVLTDKEIIFVFGQVGGL